MAFRQKIKNRKKVRFDADSADEDDDVDVASRIKAATAQPAAKAKSTAAASKLSIGDDVEEDVLFKKKKRRPKARGVSMQALDEVEAQGSSAQYSAAAIADLQQATAQVPEHFKKGLDGHASADGTSAGRGTRLTRSLPWRCIQRPAPSVRPPPDPPLPLAARTRQHPPAVADHLQSTCPTCRRR
jgi:hypothetical protein